MASDDHEPTCHSFTRKERFELLADRFYGDIYAGRFEKFDGTMSQEQRLVVFERGDSVAALLHDATNQLVLLTQQFRLPVALREDHKVLQSGEQTCREAWLVEPVAGTIRPGESPRKAIVREIGEEAGLKIQISELEEISTFYSSPGGTTELVHLFYARVRSTQSPTRDASDAAKADPNEDIRIVPMQVRELLAKVRNREITDSKLIIAAQWLKDRLATTATAPVGPITPKRKWHVVLPERSQPWWRAWRPGRSAPKVVGFMVGDIMRVTQIDAWVNPLNTDMMLDRFTDRTVAARIRAGGAERFPPPSQRIRRDTIGEELRRRLDGRNFVSPGEVIDTAAGQLKQSNDVQRLFHVAVSRGEIGESGDGLGPKAVSDAVDKVLRAIDRHGHYKSVVIPLMGTGDGGLLVSQVAPLMVESAIAFFKSHPDARLEEIYLLPYTVVDSDFVESEFMTAEKEEAIVPAPPSRPL